MGECTGLKDVGGEKLIEGDIVSWTQVVNGQVEDRKGTVYWDVHRDGWATTNYGLGIPHKFRVLKEVTILNDETRRRFLNDNNG